VQKVEREETHDWRQKPFVDVFAWWTITMWFLLIVHTTFTIVLFTSSEELKFGFFGQWFFPTCTVIVLEYLCGMQVVAERNPFDEDGIPDGKEGFFAIGSAAPKTGFGCCCCPAQCGSTIRCPCEVCNVRTACMYSESSCDTYAEIEHQLKGNEDERVGKFGNLRECVKGNTADSLRGRIALLYNKDTRRLQYMYDDKARPFNIAAGDKEVSKVKRVINDFVSEKDKRKMERVARKSARLQQKELQQKNEKMLRQEMDKRKRQAKREVGQESQAEYRQRKRRSRNSSP